MNKTWLIVAESSRARLFSVVAKNEPLVEREDLLNPSSRVHESELSSDLPGRTYGSTGSGIKHAMEPKITPKEQATIEFAQMIAERIETGRTSGELKSIILACPPKFLGLIRQHLNAETLKLIERSIDKSLVEMSEAEIRTHLL